MGNIITGDIKMKKKILSFVLLFAFFITGCDISNNPTAKVEELLSNYQMLDDKIDVSYVQFIGDVELTSDLKDHYEKVMKKQYRNLSYEIKEEKIDGDIATVTTEIKVIDFKKVLEGKKIDDNTSVEYHQEVLKELEQVTEKVVYTIDFSLKKDQKGIWVVEGLDADEQSKLLGMS